MITMRAMHWLTFQVDRDGQRDRISMFKGQRQLNLIPMFQRLTQAQEHHMHAAHVAA